MRFTNHNSDQDIRFGYRSQRRQFTLVNTPRAKLASGGPVTSGSDFSKRLQSVIGSKTQAAFAKEAGISQAGLHKLLNGGEPNLGTLIALANAGGVTVEWLATGQAEKDEAPLAELDHFALVPRYEAQASAGSGAVALSEIASEEIAFRRDWLKEMGIPTQYAKLLSATGDSMEPLIPDGALMLIDSSIREVRNGCIYVIVKDGDLLVKRVHRKIDGTISLISENPRYDPEVVSADILDKLHIVGRVRWVGRTI